MTIGERILACLEQNKKTQAELARYLNTKQSTVLGWTKLGRAPTGDVIVKICEFLNVSTDYLLTGKEPGSAMLPTLDVLLDKEGITDNKTRQSIKDIFELAKKAEQNTEFSDEFLKGESGRK